MISFLSVFLFHSDLQNDQDLNNKNVFSEETQSDF